ncbi:Uncharacterised protein [Vibrio cholerae]|nr:Uncharacterised protein [Vibrio cholerae]
MASLNSELTHAAPTPSNDAPTNRTDWSLHY